ncbi:MAG TPA: hypothetical protein VKB56_04480 [Terriglobales bacterium]|nr:hypothetical protein [Terriglobales bacterium]
MGQIASAYIEMAAVAVSLAFSRSAPHHQFGGQDEVCCSEAQLIRDCKRLQKSFDEEQEPALP